MTSRMRRILASALLFALLLSGCGRSPQRVNNQGNEAYARQDYAEALSDYQQAGEKLPEAAEPVYNAGNTLYRQGDFNQSQGLLAQALQHADLRLSQKGHYNLGNVLFQGEQYGLAAEAYREALRLDPTDTDAKHNLELALQKQEEQQQQQQQQQKQQQEEQQQSSSGRDEQDQTEDGGQDQSADRSQDEQSTAQDQPSAEEQQEDEPPSSSATGEAPPESADGNEGQSQAQPGEGMTPEQARQLLGAAAANAESLQEHLEQVFIAPGGPPEQDW
jgi:Ca-activated chloride channel homolog